ncbi:MAG: TetR/AcrR family transcriptional regulator [Pseudomonadota bacterium]
MSSEGSASKDKKPKAATATATATAARAEPGRRYRGVSEEVRRSERRQRFIEAGLDVFGGRGYHSSTVRSICASAGLTERYFYESFENSEDLLCAVYHACVQRLREHMLAALIEAPKEPELMARIALHRVFECVREDPRLARILFIEVLGVSDRVDAMYRITVEDFSNLLVRLTKPLFGDDRLPAPLDADILANALIGSIVTSAGRWLLMEFSTPIDTVVENLHTIFTGVIRQLVSVADAHSASAG